MEDKKEVRPLKKFNLELAAEKLGLAGKSENTQHDILLQYQRDYGLVLKSDKKLDCYAQLKSYGYTTSVDSDGFTTRRASDSTFVVHTNQDVITLGPLSIVSPGLFEFESFSIDGAEMYSLDLDETYITPMTCDANDLYIEKADLELFLDTGVEEIPDYANPSSEFHAPELALAMKLHNALRVNNEGNPRLSMKDQTHFWFKNHYKGEKISGAKLGRLSTIISKGKQTP